MRRINYKQKKTKNNQQRKINIKQQTLNKTTITSIPINNKQNKR